MFLVAVDSSVKLFLLILLMVKEIVAKQENQ